MSDRWKKTRVLTCGCSVTGLLLAGPLPSASAQSGESDDLRQIVAVGMVNHGEAIVLATPGLPSRGRLWRFRSFDTRDLPQPMRNVVLASSGTKLFVQPAAGPGGVLDLTRQFRYNAPLQYVAVEDLEVDGHARRQSHRLPGQRFVSVQDGAAYVLDDSGRVQREYPVVDAVHGAITSDGIAMFLRTDGTAVVCGEEKASRSRCRELAGKVDVERSAIAARSFGTTTGQAPRFMVMTSDAGAVLVNDPENVRSSTAHANPVEAALRACLLLHRMSVRDGVVRSFTDALIRESAETVAAVGQPIWDWRFFRVAVDEELYAPVLEFARLETVFPDRFEALEEFADGLNPYRGQRQSDTLYDRYLRIDLQERRRRCTMHFRTHSTRGSWIVEYWLYYPFDVGGLVSHAHDPEHIFVEVDKLGGTPRKVIGAGHGYMAGNNVFTGGRGGAQAAGLPLFAIVELGKHASAPDIDRDGLFTPGIDENEYNERAKVWGVRDVIGTINNQVLAYDTTMAGVRRPAEFLAPASARTRFPHEPDVASRAACRLEPIAPDPNVKRSLFRLSDWILLPPCHDLTSDCARKHVTAHPDFLDLRTILKEWSFPSSFLRATYGLGPRRGLHHYGLGYALDLQQIPGLSSALPLPGRLGVDAFYWRQRMDEFDRESCLRDCDEKDGAGWRLRYEQFLSNLFGIFSAAQFYSPPFGDAWITFGPFVEAPIGRRSNVMVEGGLSFRPYDSPRFELKVSAGLWKTKTNRIGLRAGTDETR